MKKFFCLFLLSGFIASLSGNPAMALPVVQVETQPVVVEKLAENRAALIDKAMAKVSEGKNLDWTDTSYAGGLSTKDNAFQDVPPTRDAAATQDLDQLTAESQLEAPTIEQVVPSQDSDMDMMIPESSSPKNFSPQNSSNKKFVGTQEDVDIFNRSQPSTDYGWMKNDRFGHSEDSDGKRKRYDFGTEIYSYSYKEPIFDLENKGTFYGVFGALTYHLRPGDSMYYKWINYYKLEIHGAIGHMRYESVSGVSKNIPDYTYEVRGVLGRDVELGERLTMTPFVGFAYRYLNDDSDGKTTDKNLYGYERESNYFFLPIGSEFNFSFNEQWQLGFSGEYDYLLAGEQNSLLSHASTAYPDIDNKQKDGYGLRFSTRLSRQGEKFTLFAEPFYRYWHIEDSSPSTATGAVFIVTGIEPENKTQEMGIKLGIQY